MSYGYVVSAKFQSYSMPENCRKSEAPSVSNRIWAAIFYKITSGVLP